MMNNIVSNVISRKAKLTHFSSVQFIKEAGMYIQQSSTVRLLQH